MSIFKRLFTIGKAEAHSAIDKLESPIKMTEQGIRELKNDLDESLKGLAQLKAMYIRTKRELEEEQKRAKDYEQKAMLLLQKAQGGGMDMAEAERLATEALNKKNQSTEHVTRLQNEAQQHQSSVSKMEGNVQKLRSNIATWENELRTLKARDKVSKATAKMNKQMASIDSSGTVNMLERMKERVSEQEALSEAYGDIANENKSLDDEIDSALDNSNAATSSDLAALKAKMGLS